MMPWQAALNLQRLFFLGVKVKSTVWDFPHSNSTRDIKAQSEGPYLLGEFDLCFSMCLP